jgi:hypothetical protein
MRIIFVMWHDYKDRSETTSKKQALLGNGHAHKNSKTFGGSIFCKVRAESVTLVRSVKAFGGKLTVVK